MFRAEILYKIYNKPKRNFNQNSNTQASHNINTNFKGGGVVLGNINLWCQSRPIDTKNNYPLISFLGHAITPRLHFSNHVRATTKATFSKLTKHLDNLFISLHYGQRFCSYQL